MLNDGKNPNNKRIEKRSVSLNVYKDAKGRDASEGIKKTFLHNQSTLDMWQWCVNFFHYKYVFLFTK